MKNFLRKSITVLVVISFLIVGSLSAQQLNDFAFKGAFDPLENAIRTEVQFNGYTDSCHNDYKEWIRYGNLFKMSIPNVKKQLHKVKLTLRKT